MNIIAIDIGNTNISIGFFLDDREEFIRFVGGTDYDDAADIIESAWSRIPPVKDARKPTTDGVIALSSTRPEATERISEIVKKQLNEDVLVVGKNLPLTINMDVDEPAKVGTDRAIAAAAAFAVVEQAVVVADFGTAITIDLVDDNGTFLGGVILPGFELAAKSLNTGTALLPRIEVSRPTTPFGKNTRDAINAGLYYSAVATLQEVTRRFAEHLGKWPKTVVTGRNAELIKEDCDFIDSFVPDLVVRGIALAYKEYMETKE